MRRFRSRITLFLLVAALVLPLGACGNKTASHKLAIYTAQANAAFLAVTDAIAVLQGTGRLSPLAAKQVYVINLRILSAIDQIRSRAQVGFDKATTLAIVRQALADLRQAEASVIGLQGEAKKRFDEIAFFAIFTLQSIEAILEAVKEPVIEGERLARVRQLAAARQVADGTVWTDLVLILQIAVLRGISQSRMDQSAAFADGAVLSRELRASLEAKIAMIS